MTPTIFAVDVARSGMDETVVMALRPGRGGHVARVVHAARGHDLMLTTGHVVRLVAAEPERFERPVVVVDVIGLGAGVHDRLAELAGEAGFELVAFNAAERARDASRFANRRAEAHWGMREALLEGQVDLDPDDDDLAAQLGALRYSLTSRGLVLIESKEAMRKRGLPSPDRGDALAMALAVRDGVAGAATVAEPRYPGKALDDLRELRERAAGELGSLVATHNLLPDASPRRAALFEEITGVMGRIRALDRQIEFEGDFASDLAADSWGSPMDWNF